MYSLQHWAQALPSVQCLNRFDTRNLLFSTKSLCAEQNQFHKALELKPQPNMSLVQVGLDLLFDKRCLIMGFSTKPVSIAALQSTFLCRSADPSLGVLKDGLYDLFWLVKTCDFTRGGKGQGSHHEKKLSPESCSWPLPTMPPQRKRSHPQKTLASVSPEEYSSLDLHASFEFQRLS